MEKTTCFKWLQNVSFKEPCQLGAFGGVCPLGGGNGEPEKKNRKKDLCHFLGRPLILTQIAMIPGLSAQTGLRVFFEHVAPTFFKELHRLLHLGSGALEAKLWLRPGCLWLRLASPALEHSPHSPLIGGMLWHKKAPGKAPEMEKEHRPPSHFPTLCV